MRSQIVAAGHPGIGPENLVPEPALALARIDAQKAIPAIAKDPGLLGRGN